MFGNADPAEPLIDIGPDNFFQGVGGVVAELAAMSAMYGYFFYLLHCGSGL
jgi:hypothetical protein